jgi:hypothetical protein
MLRVLRVQLLYVLQRRIEWKAMTGCPGTAIGV